VAGLAVFFLEIHPFKDETPVSRGSEALATLMLGIGYFLVTATFVASKPGRLRATLVWIQVGILLVLIWSAVQAYFISCCEGDFPDRIRALHRLISIRDPNAERVTGLAYEPSWYANQLNLLYLPLWLASIGLGYSAFRHRVLGIQVELLLLIAGVGALLLSSSRIGLASFIILVGFMVLWLAVKAARKLNAPLRTRVLKHFPSLGRIAGIGTILAFSIIFVIGFFALAASLLWVAGQLDGRWERVFVPSGMRLFSLEYANYLLFAERAVYWTAAYGVFERYPLIGVGLGNAGFFIPETMPAFAWALPEVVDVLRAGTEFFPNAKSLWLRLLAETGIIGFVCFAVWLLVMAFRAVTLSVRKIQPGQVVGVMGLLALISLFTEGFSVDSFAFPYLWITLGLVTAAAWTGRRNGAVEPG
jgi:O-antigen ligase